MNHAPEEEKPEGPDDGYDEGPMKLTVSAHEITLWLTTM